jgi:hypothetical protein
LQDIILICFSFKKAPHPVQQDKFSELKREQDKALMEKKTHLKIKITQLTSQENEIEEMIDKLQHELIIIKLEKDEVKEELKNVQLFMNHRNKRKSLTTPHTSNSLNNNNNNNNSSTGKPEGPIIRQLKEQQGEDSIDCQPEVSEDGKEEENNEKQIELMRLIRLLHIKQMKELQEQQEQQINELMFKKNDNQLLTSSDISFLPGISHSSPIAVNEKKILNSSHDIDNCLSGEQISDEEKVVNDEIQVSEKKKNELQVESVEINNENNLNQLDIKNEKQINDDSNKVVDSNNEQSIQKEEGVSEVNKKEEGVSELNKKEEGVSEVNKKEEPIEPKASPKIVKKKSLPTPPPKKLKSSGRNNKPEKQEKPLPNNSTRMNVILNFHGGGFVAGIFYVCS